MAKCSVEGCDRPAKTRGMCDLHYKRVLRVGSPFVSRPCLHGTTEQRFWNHVRKGAEGECWIWTGRKDKDGYGSIRDGNTSKRAHRFSYELHIGPLQPGQMVLHCCNNPSCVNPAHLRAGDHFENMEDRVQSGNYALGERHPMAKVSDEDVIRIRQAKGTIKSIAAEFGLSTSQVGNIRRGDQRSGGKRAKQ